MTRDDIVQYWLNSAQIDLAAMETLFRSGHFVWALFLGHLVLEKTLKANYIKALDENPPRTHDLLKIPLRGGLELSESDRDFLDEVTTFNIKTRYPDYKSRFHKKATAEFTQGYIRRIREFRNWLLEEIKS